MTTRVSSPNFAFGPLFINNTSYQSAAPGILLDVPDADAQTLAENGWTILGLVGTSSERPVGTLAGSPQPFRGQQFIDTTFGAVLYYDGITWRDTLTGGEPVIAPPAPVEPANRITTEPSI